jgi:alpha-ribazole phosphatase
LDLQEGTQVVLIRHGETEWNRDGRIQGHHDVPLSERGVQQAERLAEWLAGEPLDAVYTSDLQRSRVTAQIIARERVPLLLEPRLREARFGVFEGLSTAEIRAAYPEAFRLWRADAIRHRPPGGETLEDLQERCMAALKERLPLHPGQTVAVVAHGGPIRVMVCGLLELPMSVYPRLRVENTAVTRILFTTAGAILAAFNDVSHLRATPAAPAHSGWEEK